MTGKGKAILAFVVVVGAGIGGSRLKAKLDYDNNGRAILLLVKQYKDLGVPTTENEFWVKFPDQDPEKFDITLLEGDDSNETTPGKFISEMALIHLGTFSDRAVMRTQLAKSDGLRARIEKATDDFRHNTVLDRMPLASLRILVRHYCLEAVVETLEGSRDKATVALDRATRAANAYYGAPSVTHANLGTIVWQDVIETLIRVTEIDPIMGERVASLMSSKDFLAKINARGCIYEAFLTDIRNARNLDTPLLDQSRPLPFLRPFIKSPTDQEIRGSGSNADGDYLPVSRTARMLLRERLEAWKPLVTRVATGDPFLSPSQEEFDQVATLSSYISGDLARLYRGERAYSPLAFLKPSQEFESLVEVLRMAITKRAQTGEFPKSLGALPKNASYGVRDNGFVIEVSGFSRATGKPYVRFRASYPVVDSVEPKRLAIERSLVSGQVPTPKL